MDLIVWLVATGRQLWLCFYDDETGRRKVGEFSFAAADENDEDRNFSIGANLESCRDYLPVRLASAMITQMIE